MLDMKRDLPEHVALLPEIDEEPLHNLLASRAFWISGVLSLAIWAGMIYLIQAAAR
ncbi:hypothetical protein PE066_00705 [Ramlibacter tataouinensis]|uniref:hypothetical protein n=1 Tax=Ramlibacter tataouinensis TaxID=94132 RepID=UPI0022F3CCF7|nr:hypothetical protein [Ramlibacter tataouinensis]WBY02092.1 hypothetical protein PE066_00705 [Ramlibacter tataouinensis]